MTIIFQVVTVNGTPATKQVRASANLRAIVTHNRYHGKPEVEFHDLSDGGCLVGMKWPNGDLCNTTFACGVVARDWFKHRAINKDTPC